jgi:hypothetical protein
MTDQLHLAIARGGSREPVDEPSYLMIAGPKQQNSTWGLIWGPNASLSKIVWVSQCLT